MNNNAKKFVFSHLNGLSITFKPVEKGKDRPVQTMKFGEFQLGLYGLEVDTLITYTPKNMSVPRTDRRWISLHRALEYVAQAAEQSYVDSEELPTTPPQSVEPEVEETLESVEAEVEVPKKSKKPAVIV